MQLRADLQLATAIRALTEVVLPAVDADNALAVEQTQVVIGMLQLMAARLPLQYRYDCDELARLLTLCRALQPYDDDGGLAGATHAGAEVLARARATPQEILDAIHGLRTLSGAVVSSAYRDGDDAARAALSALVLTHADEQLLRERAWFAPQGWELEPDGVPPLEDLV
ncbi:MAG: hypothetical protein IPM80_11135 [Proteobacteria bacterium]|jgi:hypothetical protein|nr:hypothetical protein [Pseudomonadota bacterium]